MVKWFLYALILMHQTALGMFDTYEVTNLSGSTVKLCAMIQANMGAIEILPGNTEKFEPQEFGQLLMVPQDSHKGPSSTILLRERTGSDPVTIRSPKLSIPQSPQGNIVRVPIVKTPLKRREWASFAKDRKITSFADISDDDDSDEAAPRPSWQPTLGQSIRLNKELILATRNGVIIAFMKTDPRYSAFLNGGTFESDHLRISDRFQFSWTSDRFPTEDITE